MHDKPNAHLPLPGVQGGPDVGFAAAVDAYRAEHGISRMEVFRRLSAVTGNSPKGLSLRYYQHGDEPWAFAGFSWYTLRDRDAS